MNNYNFEHIQKVRLSYSEIMEAFNQSEMAGPPEGVPFPQANSIEKLIKLLLHLNINDLNSAQIAKLFNFTERQAYYYTSAGMYFGLIEKIPATRLFTLTASCKLAIQNTPSNFVNFFITTILHDKVFNDSFKVFIEQKQNFSKEDIYYVLLTHNLSLDSENTYKRRASTVFNYVVWISRRL